MSDLARFNNGLSSGLPQIRGTYEENASLIKYTWFRTGGPAEVLYTPLDIDDLMVFMHDRPADIPITLLGLGSNVLVRDGGVPGVVIRLGKSFNGIRVIDEKLLVGAGALDSAVSAAARDASLSGLEFLFGIPGTIGGALCMNAGAYGQEMKDIVTYARIIDARGGSHNVNAEEINFGYRSTGIPKDSIFVGAMLRGTPGDRGEIARKMEEIRKSREDSQPMRAQTGGSAFRNPELSDSAGRQAWQVIDSAGCRGLTNGGAKISEKHCNFLINTGDATSQELEDLGEMVRKRVLSRTGITLQWEIRRIGRRLPDAG